MEEPTTRTEEPRIPLDRSAADKIASLVERVLAQDQPSLDVSRFQSVI